MQPMGPSYKPSAAGKAAMDAYASLVNKPRKKKSQHDPDQPDKPQPTITRAEVLRDIPEPRAGEKQGHFVKGQLGALDEGERGVLNRTNTLIARRILVEFYRRWAAKQTAAKRGMRIR